jgi:chromosome segregation ATPase
VAANPVRKVVALLQKMQATVKAESEKEKDLFDKFMCYCDGNTDGMSTAAKAAGQKITELNSQLESEKAEKSQLDQELIQHKQDRASAKKDLETGASIRAKEHEDYVASSGEQKSNVDAMTGAIAALEKGMGGAFLQSGASKRVAMVVRGTSALDDYERQTVLSLFESKAANPFGDYSGRSGEIVGMLKAMKDSMDKALSGAISDEEAAATGYDELKAAKSAEVASSSEAIEAKTARSGELAVAIVTTKDDLKDTTAELNDTQAFLANLASQCETKKKEWAERSKMLAEEVAAICVAI